MIIFLSKHMSMMIGLKQDLYVSEPLPQTKRIMAKDEDVCHDSRPLGPSAAPPPPGMHVRTASGSDWFFD
jgi:hypothetical protein